MLVSSTIVWTIASDFTFVLVSTKSLKTNHIAVHCDNGKTPTHLHGVDGGKKSQGKGNPLFFSWKSRILMLLMRSIIVHARWYPSTYWTTRSRISLEMYFCHCLPFPLTMMHMMRACFGPWWHLQSGREQRVYCFTRELWTCVDGKQVLLAGRNLHWIVFDVLRFIYP